MRLLLVTQDYPPDRGGIQTYCAELARALAARGHAVHVVCPRVGGAAPPPIATTRLRFPGSWLFLPWALRARSLVARHASSHVLYAQWQLAALGPDLGVPTGCLVHGRELLTSVLDPATGALLPRVFTRFDASFPVSRHVETLLQARARLPASRVHRVAPGVDVERFAPRDPATRARLRAGVGLGPEHVVLLGVGRLAARKRYDRVVARLPALLARQPHVRLVLAGSGPCQAELAEQVRALGLGAYVTFLGDVADADVADVYALGDVFVLPSRGGARDVEGFGIVFLEAAACGLPVIASRSGGIEDAVQDRITGLLVDDDTELQDALERVSCDAELRQRLGGEGRARVVRELTWDHTASGIEAGLNA